MQLPSSFIARMRPLLGEAYDDFERALCEQDSQVSVRLNPYKFAEFSPALPQVPWCEAAYYFAERPTFTFDPLFHAGHYYVQEASSMFLQQVLKTYVTEPVRYLDLCAAPGGKTTLAISTLPEGSLVVGNEIDRKRVQILAENLTKWGHPATLVSNNKADDFTSLTHYFDVILTDVPCSGEGMFRKDPQAISEWSVANVMQCVDRQKQILEAIWPALRPGGLLIYSTCTYNVEENEQMIAWIAENYGAEVLTVPVDSSWGIHPALEGEYPVYRFMPHVTKGEGLFMAVVRKPDDEFAQGRDKLLKAGQKSAGKKSAPVPTFDAEVKSWLLNPADFEFVADAEGVYAFPKPYAAEMKMLRSKLRTLTCGVQVAQLKGRDWIPTHSLSQSKVLNLQVFNSFDVDYKQALDYLRRDAIQLPDGITKGWVLVTYQDALLGFVKHLGNRSNNFYPQEWRIRSGYNPDTPWSLSME